MQLQGAADMVAEAARRYAEDLSRWRQQRGLSKLKLATRMAYDRSYVSHVESCNLPPTEDFTRRAEAVLDTAGALWARWKAYQTAKTRSSGSSPGSADLPGPIVRERRRELKVGQFVAWIADHSDLSFQEAYEAVVDGVERLAARPPADRYGEAHRRAQITREQLARALVTHYRDPSPQELGAAFYRARVGGASLTLSVLVRPDWLGAAVSLGTDQERFRLDAPDRGIPVSLLEGAPLEAALHRLAAAEASATVMVNNPLYRLQDVAIARQRLQATVAVADFADYALTMDLLETELVDTMATAGRPGGDGQARVATRLPLRDVYLPTVASALAFNDRLVRHEVLSDRVEVKGLHRLAVAAA